MLAIALFLLLFALLFGGMPIAFALGISSVSVAAISGADVVILPQQMFTGLDDFTLLAVPFFILAGVIMTEGGVARRIVGFASSLVGWLPGGLAQVSLLGAAFFSSLSGSSSATTASVGGVMIPSMQERGYPRDFSAAVTAAGGTMGQIIPPSILYIMFAIPTEQSIGDLFLAGIIPGILMYLSMAAYVYFAARRRKIPVAARFNLSEVWKSFKNSVWGLLMPVIILGGIYGGVFTPTEAALVGAFYKLIISMFVYRELKWKDLGRVFYSAVLTTAMITFIFAAVKFFGWVLVDLNIPQLLTSSVTAITTQTQGVLLAIVAVCLIVGTFMNAQPAMLMLAPIFLPLTLHLGINPIFLGIVMSMALVIGVITPPVGSDLFVSAAIAKTSVEAVAKNAFPYVGVLILDVVIVVFIPQLATVI